MSNQQRSRLATRSTWKGTRKTHKPKDLLTSLRSKSRTDGCRLRTVGPPCTLSSASDLRVPEFHATAPAMSDLLLVSLQRRLHFIRAFIRPSIIHDLQILIPLSLWSTTQRHPRVYHVRPIPAVNLSSTCT